MNNKDSPTVEIFRAGEYPQGKFTEKDLDNIVDTFDAKTGVPLTLDHIKQGQAYGWVDKVERKGNTLYATFKDVTPELEKLVNERRMPKRSIELLQDADNKSFKLRAITFLGASTPAVKGLSEFHFSEEEIPISIDFVSDKKTLDFEVMDGIPIFETASGFQIKINIPKSHNETFTMGIDTQKGVSVVYNENKSCNQIATFNFDKTLGGWTFESVIMWFKNRYGTIERAIEEIDEQEDAMDSDDSKQSYNYSLNTDSEGIIEFKEKPKKTIGGKMVKEKIESTADVRDTSNVVEFQEALKMRDERLKELEFKLFLADRKSFLENSIRAGKITPKEANEYSILFAHLFDSGSSNDTIEFSDTTGQENKSNIIDFMEKMITERGKQFTLGGNQTMKEALVTQMTNNGKPKEFSYDDIDFKNISNPENANIMSKLAEKEGIPLDDMYRKVTQMYYEKGGK
jgi:hypothetical protein